jgi:hypothetical protein
MQESIWRQALCALLQQLHRAARVDLVDISPRALSDSLPVGVNGLDHGPSEDAQDDAQNIETNGWLLPSLLPLADA